MSNKKIEKSYLFFCFRYEASANTEKEVILDENDDLWVEMRHQVIIGRSLSTMQYLDVKLPDLNA